MRFADRLGNGVALCVGAAIDFAGGRAERAPQALQRVGLEWLWRLKEEPRRLGPRYAKAGPRFARLVGKDLLVAAYRRGRRR
jgi:N-acetylglucosaminyldiphosphoundecaprenol N-acetyl-beta-D-mannosaminyltransferase